MARRLLVLGSAALWGSLLARGARAETLSVGPGKTFAARAQPRTPRRRRRSRLTPPATNPSLLTFGLEGTNPGNPGHDLYVVNNTFVNDRPNGGTFVNVGAAVNTPAVLENNIFSGPGMITNEASAALTSNFSGADPLLVDPSHFDYHLRPGSPCVDQGHAPGSGAGMMLAPVSECVHPTDTQSRLGVGAPDIGAYELGAGNGASSAGAGEVPGASGAATQAGSGNALDGSTRAGGSSSLAPGNPARSAKQSSGCACRSTPGDRSNALGALLLPAAILFRRRMRARPRVH